jgi:predicted phage-related endonuclease
MYNSLISYKKEAFKELDSLAEILNFDEDKHSDIELQIDINAKDSMNMKISDFVSMCLLLAEA